MTKYLKKPSSTSENIKNMDGRYWIIKKYDVQKRQAFQRMKDKTEEQSFTNYIYKNTNLSHIESQVVFEQFSKSFLNNNQQRLSTMQPIFIATKIGAKPGIKLAESDYEEVISTLHNREDDEIQEDPAEF